MSMRIRPQHVVVLLSCGRNPFSGRPRCALRDAKAIHLARSTGLAVVGLHAGSESAVLQDYMGMGLDELVVLPMEPSQDPAPLLAGWLTLNPCSLIFSGAKAETGDGSGIVPYHVAHLLGAEVVPSIVEIHQKTSGTSVLQALPGGRRRIISIEACVVATVDSATQAVQIARAVAKRSETTPGVAVVSAQAPTLVPTPLTITTAKRMPKRIGPVSLGAKAPGQKLIQNCSAQQAAKEILQFLATERLLDSSDLANLPD